MIRSLGAFGTGGYGRSGRVGAQVVRATEHTVAISGSIDREKVAAVVNAHLQEVRACYERALQHVKKRRRTCAVHMKCN